MLKDNTMKCWFWLLTSLLWAETNFNCGITGLRKTEKMSMTILILVARARQQWMKILKQSRKWIWIIIESLIDRLLMMLAYRSALVKQLLWIFWTWNVRQRILFLNFEQKFLTKTMSHGHRSGAVDWLHSTKIQICSKSSQLAMDRGFRAMTFIPTRNHSNQIKHVKFGQMRRLCLLFSLIAISRCVMKSCHTVVRLIKNTTLKLCADCAKQFVRNTQNCGKTHKKTYHEFAVV